MKKKFFPVIAALLVFTALPAMAQSDQSNLNTRPVADAPAAVLLLALQANKGMKLWARALLPE
jgi:hypothetical protein